MNERFMPKFLKGLLSALITVGIIMIGTMLVLTIVVEDTAVMVASKLSAAVGLAIFVFMLYDLRQIICTVIEKAPFTARNVTRFKRMGYVVFLLGLIDVIVNFHNQQGSLLIGTPYGNIHTSILLYLVFGGLAITLAEVFATAVKLKEENDLTI